MSTVTWPSASSEGSITPPRVSTRMARFDVKPLRADEMHEAARTVAALLDLAAVGVEYPVAKIDVGARRLFHEQDLVAAHTEVPVRDAPDLVGPKRHVFAHAIEHDEIVAEPLHLREPQAASHCGRGPKPRSNRATGTRPLRANGNCGAIVQRNRAHDDVVDRQLRPDATSAPSRPRRSSTRPDSSTFASPFGGSGSMRTLRLLTRRASVDE